MTFEEFFIKKKINLNQLKAAEPVLFEEFRYDYSQMGEKSFDHTKKYWFNKLRRLYHLKSEPKQELQTTEINHLATQAEPLSSPTIADKPGYIPRFKPGMGSKPKQENITEITDTSINSEHPLSIATHPSDTEVLPAPPCGADENKPTAPKPAYKPRFKPGMLNQKPPEDPHQA